MLCTPWTCFSGHPVGPGEGSPRCEPRTHFGCELAARFGPSSVHYMWLPKMMPVRAEPGPKSGPRFCLPSLRTSYQARGARVAGYLASGPAGAAVSALLACSHNSAKLRGRQYQKPCCVSQGVMAALPRRAEFQTLQSNGASSAPGARGRADGALLHQFQGSSHLLRMTGCLCPACFRQATVEFGRTAPGNYRPEPCR